MAIWYEVKKNEKSITNFLECNWYFHDFRVEKVEYIPGKDMVEVFLKYDSMTEGVLLRFAWIHDFHVYPFNDYDAYWIFGSQILTTDKETMIWMDRDDLDLRELKEEKEYKKYTTYVEAERIMWAVTDADGNPVELPEERKTSMSYKNLENPVQYYEINEFTDNWDEVLKPWYIREKV